MRLHSEKARRARSRPDRVSAPPREQTIKSHRVAPMGVAEAVFKWQEATRKRGGALLFRVQPPVTAKNTSAAQKATCSSQLSHLAGLRAQRG